jgi:homoserine kinase
MDQVTVLSPATVSNVVCGFDCLGFALREPFDEMTLRKTAQPGVVLIHHDDYGLPTEPGKNVAGVALKAFADAAAVDHGYELEITKHIKPGSGIGSSAASACGAVVAANLLAGGPFSNVELIEVAMAGEVIASGSRHADNLAPCILGGFTLVRSTEPLDVVSLDFPEIYATVIHPQIEIKTSEARALLPREVPLADAVRNWSNLGAFVAALHAGDHELLARSMVDNIVEPARSPLIPKFDDVKRASLDAGAIGGGISGSGPSMFMLSTERHAAEAVADAMSCIYKPTGIRFNTYVSRVSPNGVRMAP